jgi:hypothetical protein
MLRRRSREAKQEPKPEPEPKRKKRRVTRLFSLVILGAAAALAASEGARGKVLDALFGSEEEFSYTPPQGDGGNGQGA